MIITINTDASYSHKYNIGTYAFWIASNEGKFFRSGSLKGSVYSPIHAEMKCIINALHYVFENPELKSVKRIIVNTDCLFAIHKFEKPNVKWVRSKDPLIINESNSIKNRFMKIYNVYITSKDVKRKVTIEYRHLKSHKHTDDARHYVNEMCDMEAKKQMGIALKKIIQKNNGKKKEF